MTYACPEWLGNRNFGMPELNSSPENKRRTPVLALATRAAADTRSATHDSEGIKILEN